MGYWPGVSPGHFFCLPERFLYRTPDEPHGGMRLATMIRLP